MRKISVRNDQYELLKRLSNDLHKTFNRTKDILFFAAELLNNAYSSPNNEVYPEYLVIQMSNGQRYSLNLKELTDAV
jgi:hypothetical protein